MNCRICLNLTDSSLWVIVSTLFPCHFLNIESFYLGYPKHTPVSSHLHAHSRDCVYSGKDMGCSFAWQRAENRTFVLLSCFYQQCTNIVLVLVSTSHLICISALFFFWKRSKSFDLIWLRWHTVRFLGQKQFCLFACFIDHFRRSMNEYPY